MKPRSAARVLREVPELHSGDHMTRKEFHRLCALAPPGFRAELIGGIVYVASAVSLKHGKSHSPLDAMFYRYETKPPGVEVNNNATVALGDDSEPQPDLLLRILPEFGSRTTTTTFEAGLTSPEHTEFVQRLERQRVKAKKPRKRKTS